MDYINKLIQGNSLEIMNKMIEENILVDAIITDPPYDISRDNNFKTMGRSGIDFGEWDKNFNQFTWIPYAYKLLKKGGTLFIFNDWKNIGEIAKYAESIGFEIKDMIRWKKTNPMPRNRDRRYITDFEVAIWLVKPKEKWTFNRLSDTYDRCEYTYPVTPKSEKVGHTTQKPLELMKEIIQRHTNENDIVFDPFTGSGTTNIASIELNRKYIGVELDNTYYNIAKNRINTYLEKKNFHINWNKI
ncbi:DNA-methyltransferase [Clostridium sp. CTA-6]